MLQRRATCRFTGVPTCTFDAEQNCQRCKCVWILPFQSRHHCVAYCKRDMNDQNARERIVELVTSLRASLERYRPRCGAACRPLAFDCALTPFAPTDFCATQELDELFKTYYSADAVLDHVALSVKGRNNIKKVCCCAEARPGQGTTCKCNDMRRSLLSGGPLHITSQR